MQHSFRLFSILFISLLVFRLHAQIPQNPVSVQSPNAASLGLYTGNPVSSFTGIPSISVPLYTLKGKSISLPISLNYHASGFRPDQHPGWVGQGWNLEAGGMITRTVRDRPDDYSNGTWFINASNLNQTSLRAGYYWNCGVLSAGGYPWNTVEAIRLLTRSRMQLIDTEPDEFSFNFLGYSGKFYRDSDCTWKAKCDKPIKIELNTITGSTTPGFLPVPFPPNLQAQSDANSTGGPHGYSPSFAGFTITTEDGVQYMFGGNTDAIEYSIGFFTQQTDEWVANSWQLTKIIPVTGAEINLNYAAGDYICQMYISMNYYAGSSTVMSYSNPNQGINLTGCSRGSAYSSSLSQAYEGKLIRPSYLNYIESLNTRINFNRSTTVELDYPAGVFDYKHSTCNGLPLQYPTYEPRTPNKQSSTTDNNVSISGGEESGPGPNGTCNRPYGNCFFFLDESSIGYPCCVETNNKLIWKKLASISITEGGQLAKQVNLTYSNTAAERLTLSSVAEVGSDATTAKGSYRFNYYPYSYAGSTTQPPYLSNRVDHWGYFNDVTAPLPALASPTPDFTNYWSLREPTTSASVCISGLLESIIYPTGGKTQYEYEQHDYAQKLAIDRASVVSVTSDMPTGGVRIKRITSYDDPAVVNRKLETSYQYSNSNGRSSGILGGETKYWFPGYRLPPAYSQNTNTQYVNFLTQSTFSTQGVLPASSNAQGNHIGYSRVTQTKQDGSKTISTFTNFTEVLDPQALNLQLQSSPYQPYSSCEEGRGKLTQELAINNVGQTVGKTEIYYTNLSRSGIEFVPAIKAKATDVCSPGTLNFTARTVEEGTAYKNHIYSTLPSGKVIITYDLQGNILTTNSINYRYNADNLLKSEIIVDSENQEVETTYTYAYERPYNGRYPFNSPLSSRQIGIISAMTSMSTKNMLAFPVEVITKKNGFITKAQVTNYSLWGNKVLPYEIWTLDTTKPLATSSYTPVCFCYPGAPQGYYPPFTPDSHLSIKSTFTDYDALGNVTGLRRTGESKNSYQWGYGGLLPVATFANASRSVLTSSNLGNEGSYFGFERAPGQMVPTDVDADYWSLNLNPTVGNVLVATAHTGTTAFTVGPPSIGQPFNYGPGRVFAPERQQFRYKFSAWVKTDATFPASGGALVLSLNRADGTPISNTANCYQAAYFNGTNGTWRYIEVLIDLGAAHASAGIAVGTEQFQVSAYCLTTAGGTYTIDDLRFHPAESAMTTSTYEPNSQQPTSISNTNSVPTKFEFDPLQRLKIVRDLQGNIISGNKYNYRP